MKKTKYTPTNLEAVKSKATGRIFIKPTNHATYILEINNEKENYEDIADEILKSLQMHDELVSTLKLMYEYFGDILINDDENKSKDILTKAKLLLQKESEA